MFILLTLSKKLNLRKYKETNNMESISAASDLGLNNIIEKVP
jgi:hypothetical protein